MEIFIDPSLRAPLFIGSAFLFGLGASAFRLPPLVGFLLAGVALRALGLKSDANIRILADLGITLLMFTIGLKLRIRSLFAPVIWAGTSSHLLLSTALFAAVVGALSAVGVSPFIGLDYRAALLLGFALSFSSTVFAVKTLEQSKESHAPHGVTSIGFLIMQDVIAVLFLSISLAKTPSPWAFCLLAFFPLRGVMKKLLERSGHSDLLVACGIFLGLFVGAFLFSVVGLKADLGALIVGALVAGHPKAKELSNLLLGFKELLLIAFFLNIGLSESLTMSAVLAALLLTLFLPIKVFFYFLTMVRFRLNARHSFLSSAALANFSEFGLIVAAVGVQLGVIGQSWMVVLALALTITFILAAPLNRLSHELETRWRPWLIRWESRKVAREASVDLAEVDVIILGMGRIGVGAYDELSRQYDQVLGVDFDRRRVEGHIEAGRRVVRGDPTDPAFWERVEGFSKVPAVVFALPAFGAHCLVAQILKKMAYEGFIFAVAHFQGEVEKLQELCVTGVYVYSEAGAGLAAHVHETILTSELPATLSCLPAPPPTRY